MTTKFSSLYYAADGAAVAAQKSYLIQIGGSLFCASAGAFASSLTHDHDWLVVPAAALFLGGLAFGVATAFQRLDEKWYAARSLAESIKTRSWRYMMRARPFDCTDVEAKQRLVDDLGAFLASIRNVAEFADEKSCSADLIPDEMTAIRLLPLSRRRDVYRSDRIEEQKRWYANKAQYNKRHGKVWYGLMIATNTVAVVLLLGGIKYSILQELPADALGALAASFLSWLQVRRFRELSVSYQLAAHEISLIEAESDGSFDDVRFSTYVSDAENAFSREHTQWRARKN